MLHGSEGEEDRSFLSDGRESLARWPQGVLGNEMPPTAAKHSRAGPEEKSCSALCVVRSESLLRAFPAGQHIEGLDVCAWQESEDSGYMACFLGLSSN